MAKLLRMPEVAANAAEAVLQEWSVADNTPFSAEDAIATVETEKAVVDVEAETDGVILKTLVPAGARVAVGAPIAVLGEPGEKVDDLAALLAELGVSSDGPVVTPERREVPRHQDDTATAVVAAHYAANGHATGSRTFASPLARRLAREAGLSVEDIAGTGPGGRIIRRDVDAAVAGKPDSSSATQTASATREAVVVESGTVTTSTYTDIPHSRIRRAMAARLTESKQTTPHFYLRGTVRVDRLLKVRDELNQVATVKISVNDMVVKAAARAHTLVPEMNVIWTPDAVRSFSSVDISVAVATESGLVTPVLRAVEGMSISSVAANLRDLVERARAGQLRQNELEGGALSITNLGMFGTEEFAAIINPPQAAILAVGAARREPVVKKGKLATGTVMRVTLSVDHRPVDGAVAAQWMQAFVSVVENPVQILA